MASLKDYSIKNILAIDDVFYQIDGNTVISLLDEEMITIFDSVNDLNGDFIEFVDENPDHSFFDFFEEFEINDSSAKPMLEVINNRSQSSYTQLSQLSDVDFIACAPEVEKIKKKLDSLVGKDEKTLIVLDRKLAGTNESEGLLKLSSILSIISTYLKVDGNLFLIMYSSEPKKLSSYNATVDYLKSELALADEIINDVALHINFLPKDVTAESEVINVLRKSQKANYVNSFDEIFDKSMSSLRERIWDLSHNESLLHYDYLVEGQQIDQIIFNILLDKFRTSYMEYMEKSFVNLINPMRNSIQKYEKNRMLEETIELDKVSEKYRFIKEVNIKLHGGSNTTSIFPSDDISFGDIIEIADSNYIIVSQNCDITIRQNGERAVQSFQLIKVTQKEERINAQWLASFFSKYASSTMKINLNENGNKYFKNTFFNLTNETELQLMGFEEKYLQAIEATLASNNVKNALKRLVFEADDKNLGASYEYEIDKKSKEIYTVPCFWIDCLLLRTDNNKEYIVTKKSIQSSKEIRYATKICIENDFNEMIRKFSLLSKDDLIVAFKNNMFNPLVDVEPVFDEDDKLYGFKLLNISRFKKMKPHVARKIHLEMISKQTREAVNESIPI
ncbi:hypothetical protein [Enterococcus faecium]|uniref:hypothetical protein n=1 Tax=Enterococcus faecium TaxID=1352 RepID=UPI0020914D47|nr:hypothetical protein [Enterococcus faecium]MCO5451556.1 hypothetical protein [Enterococcus faecium]